jgi:hypothetical protein
VSPNRRDHDRLAVLRSLLDCPAAAAGLQFLDAWSTDRIEILEYWTPGRGPGRLLSLSHLPDERCIVADLSSGWGRGAVPAVDRRQEWGYGDAGDLGRLLPVVAAAVARWLTSAS